MNTITARTVLVDIDGTLTRQLKSDVPETNGVDAIAELILRRDHIPIAETRGKLTRIYDPERECLTTKLALFKISRREFWEHTFENFRRHYRIFPDAVVFLKSLRTLPVKVYTATTNSEFIARMKLATGLDSTDWDFCRYLDGYFPGNAFGDPRGKCDPEFISKIIRYGNFDPARTVMIGDDPKYDLYPARHAGIRYCVIIDRTSREPWREENGTIYINSLETVAQALWNGCYENGIFNVTA